MSRPVIESLPKPPDWTADALCAQVGGELFYVEKGESTKPAKAVCALCPVIDECLSYALANDERFGVWGNKTAVERRKMKQIPA